jgi:hypothetical protein
MLLMRSILATVLSAVSIGCLAQLRERPPITIFSVAQSEPDGKFVLCEDCPARTLKRPVPLAATPTAGAEVIPLLSIGKRSGAP